MLTHISWTDYFLFTGAAILVYYLFLAATVFRKDLSKRTRQKKPAQRGPMPIPVIDGVMGSVLYDEEEEEQQYHNQMSSTDQPAKVTGGGAASDTLAEDQDEEEEEDDPYDADAYDNDAKAAADWDIMQDLISRMDDTIRKAPKSVTPAELIDELLLIPTTEEKEVLQKFQESVSVFLTERLTEKLHLRVTDALLRPLWR